MAYLLRVSLEAKAMVLTSRYPEDMRQTDTQRTWPRAKDSLFFWLLNRVLIRPPLTARQVSNIQEAGPGLQPGKEALGLSSDGSVTNAVLAWATPLSFVCLLESDLWFVPNRNGLQPLTHLSVYICDKISLPVPAKRRVDGGVSFELNIRL